LNLNTDYFPCLPLFVTSQILPVAGDIMQPSLSRPEKNCTGEAEQ